MKKEKNAPLAIASAILLLVTGPTVLGGVCKIGSTEYDTLHDAVAAVCNGNGDATITLLADIGITSEILVSEFPSGKTCTIDGDGHAIRQAYAGRLFRVTSSSTRFTFKNVTVLGGGEACSTVDAEIRGTFFCIHSNWSRLTLDSGCVVSNFVSYGALIGADVTSYYPSWNVFINPGSTIACNSSTQDGCILYVTRWNDSTRLEISGGEIFGNRAPSGTIAYLDAMNQNRTNPICVISGGRIHDNVATSSNGALFYCDYGPLDVQMTGGEIFDNDAVGFYLGRGGQYLNRLHLSGGKIFCNTKRAVHINQKTSPACVLLSGDAVVAGKYDGANPGIFLASENQVPARVALEGDFNGFATVCGNYGSSYRADGCVYGTNLNSYAGAENIHLANSTSQILQTKNETGELIIRSPQKAKIGTTEYDTFADALALATDGSTITLLQDCIIRNSSIVPPANKAITVDGSGYRIFRMGKAPLVKATTAGGNMTFINVELNEGYYTSPDSYTNHVDGVLVNTANGIAATITLGPGTVLSGGRGTNALVRVANGATVNLDGCVITGAVNRAVAASAGGTLGVKGATIVKDNAGGDINVANGNILSLNGNLTGSVHVTVAGAEACEGQRFGTRTGEWTGYENFINGGADPKLQVSKSGALVWCRRGFVITFR